MKPRVIAAVVVLGLICLGVYRYCSEPVEPGTRVVRVASWGGGFQKDLLDEWLGPSAKGVEVALAPESWEGDYSALAARIQRGTNEWDLVHVEAFFVQRPDAADLFESFPTRRLAELDPTAQHLELPTAVPVLEYAYVLVSRSNQAPKEAPLTWKVFFDPASGDTKRGLRDFPIGNIEAAIVALGRRPEEALYRADLPQIEVEERVSEALGCIDRVRENIVWWRSGDQLFRGLIGGDTPWCAAWSGRALKASIELRNGATGGLVAFPESALVSTDWWVIPKGARAREAASDLLAALYSARNSEGARNFAEKTGYSVPIRSLSYADPLVREYLELVRGTRGVPPIRLSERFWSRNFDWISERWRAWRAR